MKYSPEHRIICKKQGISLNGKFNDVSCGITSNHPEAECTPPVAAGDKFRIAGDLVKRV